MKLVKDRVESLFKTNALEEYGKKTVYGSENESNKLKI